MPELDNPKREAFCKAYIINLNATQAARAAGYSDASDNCASATGWTLMQDTEVKARIAELMEIRAEECKVDANYVLSKLKVISEAKIEDYVVLLRHEVETGSGNKKKIEVINSIVWKSFDEMTPEQRGAIQSIEQGRQGIKLKLFDKSWSLDMIAKHIGLYEKDNDQKKNETLGIGLYLPDNGRARNPTGQ